MFYNSLQVEYFGRVSFVSRESHFVLTGQVCRFFSSYPNPPSPPHPSPSVIPTKFIICTHYIFHQSTRAKDI